VHERLTHTLAALAIVAALVLCVPVAGLSATQPQAATTCARTFNAAVAAGEPANDLQPFVLVTAVNGYRELLSASTAPLASIESMRLLPAASESAPVKCSGIRLDDAHGVSLSGAPCAPVILAHAASGPDARFVGAARSQYAAAVRVNVEDAGSAPKSAIDDSIEFSVDDGSPVTLPARGVEPVSVTASFPYLSAGPHRIAYFVYKGRDDSDDPPQGMVCI
jgi:hypothetical protein